MTSAEFAALSTQLFTDLTKWVTEASKGMSLRLLKFTGGGSVDDYAICRSS